MSFNVFSIMLIGYPTVFAHILGDIFKPMRVLTRFSGLNQLPLSPESIFLSKINGGMFRPYPDCIVFIVVLLRLAYFPVIGNGP